MNAYNFVKTISKKNRKQTKMLKNAEKRVIYIVLIKFFHYLCSPKWTF